MPLCPPAAQKRFLAPLVLGGRDTSQERPPIGEERFACEEMCSANAIPLIAALSTLTPAVGHAKTDWSVNWCERV